MTSYDRTTEQDLLLVSVEDSDADLKDSFSARPCPILLPQPASGRSPSPESICLTSEKSKWWPPHQPSSILSLRRIIFIVALIVLTNFTVFVTLHHPPSAYFPHTHTRPSPHLRILPLGDSITNGFQHTRSNGYRADLAHLLNTTHHPATFVGSQHSGNFRNNAHEGHNSATISQIASAATRILPRVHPNIVLLLAGINDMNSGAPSDAPRRLASLIAAITEAEPDAVVLVGTLTPSWSKGTMQNVREFNEVLPEIVDGFREGGRKVLLVQTGGALDAQTDLADFLHPNDKGYRKLAEVWFEGILEVEEMGWVVEPVVHEV